MSSAIVLPSVTSMQRDQREFMVYEATFSDILGIMLFYFLVDDHGMPPPGDRRERGGQCVRHGAGLLLVGIALIWVFQRIRTRVKFFRRSRCSCSCTLGKKMNLSSLLIILVFGLMVKNHGMIFRGWISRLTCSGVMHTIEKELHLITGETAFLVRSTFFFLVFGLTIDVTRLADLQVLLLGGIIVVVIYAVRSVFVGCSAAAACARSPWWRHEAPDHHPAGLQHPDHLRIPDRDGSILLEATW